jgi:hypothetical protein
MIGSGLVLSTGLVTWFLRKNSLRGSLMAALPEWHRFDLLPVLNLTARERNKREYSAQADAEKEDQEVSGLQ